MTEAEVRAALAAFDGLGGMERWMADRSSLVASGGRVVPEPFQGWRFRAEPALGGGRVTAFPDMDEPAAWTAPA